MPHNWKTYLLGEVSQIICGGTPSTNKPEYWGNEIDWVTAKDISNAQTHKIWETERKISELGLKKSSAKYLPSNTTALIARGATMGKTKLFGKPMAINQTCYGLVANGVNLDSIFQYYYFLNNYNLLVSISHGSVFNTVIGSGLKNLPILLPPLPEQQAIAEILGTLDDKIELNRKTNQTLEQMAMALYKHYFVDFGPFQNGEFELSEYIELNPSVTLKKGQVAKYVEMKALPIDAMSVSPSEIIEKEYSGGAKFKRFDTLFARITPCLENGKTAFVDFLRPGEVAFGSTEFLVLRAKRGVSPYWVYCLSRDSAFRSFAISTMVGSSGRQRVQSEPLQNWLMQKPEEGLMDLFQSHVKNWFGQIEVNSRESQTLAQLRDTLLPKLISGEIRVRDIEKQIAEKL
ncbi:MAG: restriction endonuclease subunit S [Bacteroidia bacterium]|nr:restriction endonuclease subunit S [Bacteroidia bacterium]